jgi:hypothetical protein
MTHLHCSRILSSPKHPCSAQRRAALSRTKHHSQNVRGLTGCALCSRWRASFAVAASAGFLGERSHQDDWTSDAETLPELKKKQGAGRHVEGTDLTAIRIQSKRPASTDWVPAPLKQASPGEAWVHQGTGLVAVSTVVAGADRVFEYRLKIWIPGGGRCSAAEAFVALADFGLLDAVEHEVACRSGRLFREAVVTGT